MTSSYLAVILLLLPSGASLQAASSGAFSGNLPNYTFTAFCADPAGASILFGSGPCTSIDIDYTATGSTSLFANSELTLQTFLSPLLPGPFPFIGTFTLTNVDNPADSISGTLAGAGNVAGAPGPPVGFPPFVIAATLTTVDGTGAFENATGVSLMSGTALFTFLNGDTTFASGEGSMSVSAVPEPATASLLLASIVVGLALRRSRTKTQLG